MHKIQSASTHPTSLGTGAGLPVTSAVGALLAQQPERERQGAFSRWYLERKFGTMERVFQSWLLPGSKFVDMCCGTGDGLVLAKICQGQCELWGFDIDDTSLNIARQRVPSANLYRGDMHSPDELPKGYFDVVHEFGATFYSRRWDVLAKSYLSLLREGGVLLWELPQKWSSAHLSYLLTPAPKITEQDTKIKRLFRSFSPYKYHYESDANVLKALDETGWSYEIVERVPMCYAFYPSLVSGALDRLSPIFGNGMYGWLDRATARVWPRYSGYYLVVRKGKLK